MQAWAFKHEDFADRVQVEFRHKLHGAPATNAISSLLLLKESVRFVHDNIVKEKEVVIADNTEDRLGWALIYVRALERRNFDRACVRLVAFLGWPLVAN